MCISSNSQGPRATDKKGKIEMTENMKKAALEHNQSVDRFRNENLRKHFGSDKITAEQWFEAQRMIADQCFYTKGIKIVRALRKEGIDAKINAQSEKIYCPEIGLFDR